MSYYCESCQNFKNLIKRNVINEQGQVMCRVVGVNCRNYLSVIEPDITYCVCRDKETQNPNNREIAKDQSTLGGLL